MFYCTPSVSVFLCYHFVVNKRFVLLLYVRVKALNLVYILN